MADIKKPVATTSVDPWETDKATWQFVTIDEQDVTGKDYPTIWLNKLAFKAGQTYQVPGPVAQYLKDRIKAYNQSVVRLFNPRVDMDALRVVPVGSAPAGPTSYVDATKITTL